jgi:hypothetical protein
MELVIQLFLRIKMEYEIQQVILSPAAKYRAESLESLEGAKNTHVKC